MKSSQSNLRAKWMETGRVIAHAMNEVNVQKEKNMAKADKRKATMLENAAEKALSGSNY